MRIWLFNPFEPLPAEGFPVGRYQMLATVLAERHHNVVWWSSDYFHFGKRYRSVNIGKDHDCPFEIRQIHARPYRSNISLRRLYSHFFHAVSTYSSAVERGRLAAVPDLVVSYVPPVALPFACAVMARKFKARFCVDVGDPWPDSFATLLPNGMKFIGTIALIPYRMMLKRALRTCVGMTAVSQTYLNWALRYSGEIGCRAQVIYPGAVVRVMERVRPDPRKPLRLAFVGTFGKTYDLETVVRVAAALEKRRPGEFVFDLVGNGPCLQVVQETCSSPNVKFHGSLQRQGVERVLRDCDVGLCAYARNAPQTMTTKLFEYLSYGLPVVGTLEGEMADFLSEHDVGATAGGVCELEEVLLDFRDDELHRLKQSKNALEIGQKHNLKNEMIHMAEFLENLS